MKRIWMLVLIILSSTSIAMAGKPAARLGDMTMHGGSIVLGYPMVLIGGMPAARIGDYQVCPMLNPGYPPIPHVGGPICLGSPMVLIGGMPAARMGDMAVCVGPPSTIALGCPTVLVGEGGSGSESGFSDSIYLARRPIDSLIIDVNNINLENPGIRIMAIYQLGERKALSAVTTLSEILENDTTHESRTLSAISLYKIEDERGIQAIKGVMDNDADQNLKDVCARLYESYIYNKNNPK